MTTTDAPRRVWVTAFVDIDREQVDQRRFDQHYLDGFARLAVLPWPLVVFCEPCWHEQVMALRGERPTCCLAFGRDDLRTYRHYDAIARICRQPEWIAQSPFIASSILTNPDYLTLTLFKIEWLRQAVTQSLLQGDHYYWIDTGICQSYLIDKPLDGFDWQRLPSQPLFFMAYPYASYLQGEVHGYSVYGYLMLCREQVVRQVVRASLFGGEAAQLIELARRFDDYLQQSLAIGCIGTEESILSALRLNYPELVGPYVMPSGDVKHYINTLSLG